MTLDLMFEYAGWCLIDGHWAPPAGVRLCYRWLRCWIDRSAAAFNGNVYIKRGLPKALFFFIKELCVGMRLVSAVEGICHIWVNQTQKGAQLVRHSGMKKKGLGRLPYETSWVTICLLGNWLGFKQCLILPVITHFHKCHDSFMRYTVI